MASIMAPLMDEAAKELGIDRVAIRLRNATDSDTLIYADQGPVTSAYMEEAITQGAERFDWQAVGQRYAGIINGMISESQPR